MSQDFRPRDLEAGDESGNDYLERHHSPLSFETSRGGLHFRDSSRLLFSMYSKIAEEKDNKMVERWQNDAEAILIFAGLFSAVVAQLLSVTALDLKPGPQPPPSSQTNSCEAPPSLVADSSTSSPSTSAISVNSLWFLSLVISLTCAMLATFIQRWARRYIKITQSSQYSPHKRARLRAFFSEGVDKWHVSWAVEALPTLLHLSLFLFFIGLVVYLFNTNRLVFCIVVWWVVLSMMAYLSITLLPIFRPNSPYYAPLSSLVWSLQACVSYAVFKVLSSPIFTRFGFDATNHFRRSRNYSRQRFSEDIRKTAEATTLERASDIDVHVLESILDSLGEDVAWEKFFEAVPGFFNSELVNVPKENLPNEFRIKFNQALSGFLDCTFSLNSVTQSLRSDRLVICLNAVHAALGSEGASQILQDILNGRWPELLQSVEIGHSLRRWRNSDDEQFTTNVRRIVAQIVVGVRERDGRWFSLVKAEYGIREHVLREYTGHGDSVLLSILIHMIRQAIRTGSWSQWVLSSLSEFNVLDTSPELRHVFCALWNDIILKARNEEGPINIPVRILRDIRQVYIALHPGTDAALTAPSASPYYFHPDLDQPRSYRLCTVASHRRSLSIHTPRAGSSNLPSVTPLNQSPAASPLHFSASPLHSSPTDSDHPHDVSTALRQGEEANIVVTIEPPSSREDTPDPSYTQGFTSLPPTTNSVHVTPAASIASLSVPENTAYDPGLLLVPGEASHDRRQSASSAAGIAAVRSDDLTPPIRTSESGESSQVFVAPSLIFQHPDAVPAAITPSTVLNLGDDPGALQDTSSYATPEGNGIVVSCTSPEIRGMSSTVNPISSIPTVSPAIAVSESPPSPVPVPALSSSVTATGSPSSVQSAPLQPDHFLQALRSLSSLATNSPQLSSAFDVQITLRFGMPSPHDDTAGQNPPIPVTILLHLAKAESPVHDTVASTLQPEGQVQADLDKS